MPNYVIMWLPLRGRNCVIFFFSSLQSLDVHIFIHTTLSLSTITSTPKSKLLSKVMTVLKITKNSKAIVRPHCFAMRTGWHYENGCPSIYNCISKACWNVCVYVTAYTEVYICTQRNISWMQWGSLGGRWNVRLLLCTSNLVKPSLS